MIFEATVLLCWATAGQPQCGRMDNGKFWHLAVPVSGDVQVSCGDGSFPVMTPQFHAITGPWDISCGDGSTPIQTPTP